MPGKAVLKTVGFLFLFIIALIICALWGLGAFEEENIQRNLPMVELTRGRIEFSDENGAFACYFSNYHPPLLLPWGINETEAEEILNFPLPQQQDDEPFFRLVNACPLLLDLYDQNGAVTRSLRGYADALLYFEDGFSRIEFVMQTGENLSPDGGINRYYTRLLPEDLPRFWQQAKASGIGRFGIPTEVSETEVFWTAADTELRMKMDGTARTFTLSLRKNP